jgi:hypothetical protein
MLHDGRGGAKASPPARITTASGAPRWPRIENASTLWVNHELL